ncbi:MAG: sensor histidine kinase [Anaerolineae bacterium]|nr:sensor histidine kinase [Anaerolineae bacterium]
MNYPKPRRLLHTTDWAFLVVVVAAYVSFFTAVDVSFTGVEALSLVVVGLLYTAIGTYGFENFVFSAPLGTKILYYVLQFPLVIGITLLSHFSGAFWLLLLPLVSHGAVLFTRTGVLVISVLTALLFGLSLGIPNGWQVGLTATLSFAPGVVFVVIFTQMAISESRARHQVEDLAQDLAEAHATLAQYAVQAEELATAKERNRLAREIHDSLGHYLTAINVQLEVARTLLESEPSQALPPLERAQSLAKEGLHEVRRSVAALRASPLEGKPLATVLATLVEELRASGIEATFDVQGEPRALPPQLELALYRVTQEALTNICKHAQARHAEITLNYAVEAVRLKVQDDGIGSDAPAGGFGLVGLRERVQLLGGEMHCGSEPGKGFVLEISVPLQE